MRGWTLLLAVRLTLIWVSLYTHGLAPKIRNLRRMEVTSDLWEHQQAERLAGRHPIRTSLSILLRCLSGVADDLSWRRAKVGAGERMPRQFSLRNTLVVVAAIIVIVVGAIFASGLPTGGVSRPEVMADRHGMMSELLMTRSGPSDLVGCIKLCWFADKHSSAIILYSVADHLTHERGGFGWELVGESGGSWYSLVSGRVGGYASELEEPPVSFFSMQVPDASITFRYGVRNDYVVTAGRVFAPEVAQVDIRYDTGQTVRADVTNGAFAVFADAKTACGLDLIDPSGDVVQRIGPSDDPMLAMEIQRQNASGCTAA